MKKAYLIAYVTLLLSCFTTEIKAQYNFFEHNELPEKSGKMKLNGKGGLLVFSPHDNLTFDSPQKAIAPFTVDMKKTPSEGFMYTVAIDLSKQKQIKIIIGRKGSAQSTEITRTFSANHAYAYNAEEVNNAILLNQETDKTGSSAKHGNTDIQITTTVSDLTVRCDQALNMAVRKTKNAAGALVFNLTFANNLSEKSKQLDALNAEYEALYAKCYEEQAGTEEEMNRCDMLEKEVDAQRAAFSRLTTLTIKAPESNTLTISLANTQANEKRFYTVDARTEKEMIYNRSYDQYLGSAQQAFQTRKYNTAADFYKQAAAAEDATEEERASATKLQADMEQCYEFMKQANAALKALGKAKEGDKMVNLGLARECYRVAIANFNNLHKITADDEYTRRVKMLQGILDKLPVVYEGIVEIVDKKGGIFVPTPTGKASIYGLTHYADYMKKGKWGDYLGSPKADGTFHIEAPAGKYKYLLFVPDESTGTKKNAIQELKDQENKTIKASIYKK